MPHDIDIRNIHQNRFPQDYRMDLFHLSDKSFPYSIIPFHNNRVLPETLEVLILILKYTLRTPVLHIRFYVHLFVAFCWIILFLWSYVVVQVKCQYIHNVSKMHEVVAFHIIPILGKTLSVYVSMMFFNHILCFYAPMWFVHKVAPCLNILSYLFP